MGWTSGALPVLWAQAAASSPARADTGAMARLALRRWFAGLTLSSPESVPSLFGVWVWLAAMGGLLALALAFQGPASALGQLVDVPGHARLVAASNGRLRRAYRMLAAAVGLTVLSWTGSQSLAYDKPEGRDDVVLLTRARHPVELAVEQGVLAALTPLRDVAGLGSNLPLLVVATLLLFRASADVWAGAAPPPWAEGWKGSDSGWANAGWSCGALMILYRLVSVGTGMTEVPLSGCLMVECLVVPALTAVCDGLLLGWVVAELRGAGPGGPGADALDTRAAVDLMPASVAASLAALPARYVATAVLMASDYAPSWVGGTAVGAYARWQLGHGLTYLQGAALPLAGLAGAAAWSGGGVRNLLRVYGRVLSSQGARVFVVLGLSGLAAGVVSAAAYVVVLALPAAPWVLNAADSYAHYGTLAVGLWVLSALVELGERSLADPGLAGADGPGRVG